MKGFLIGVEIAKEGVGEAYFPHCTFEQFPILNPFRAFNYYLFALGGLVGNSTDIAVATVLRLHPFPVFAGMVDHLIAGFSNRSRF